jgi:hypothetical protein
VEQVGHSAATLQELLSCQDKATQVLTWRGHHTAAALVSTACDKGGTCQEICIIMHSPTVVTWDQCPEEELVPRCLQQLRRACISQHTMRS